MIALQKEQMEEQKRQYEEQKAEQEKRYAEQKAIAEAPPAPAPSPVAMSAASALEITDGSSAAAPTSPLARSKGYGRKQFRTDLEAGSGLNIP
jgi:sRNA-binding protein